MSLDMEQACRDVRDVLCRDVVLRNDGVLECCLDAESNITHLKTLRDDPRTKMRVMTDVFAVDYYSRTKRFEVVYMLLSIVYNARLCCKVSLEEGQKIQSALPVYGTAGWFEREIYDMYGIEFNGHPDLRRILTDYGFSGHPMLKDFPLTGYEEIKYDFQTGKVAYKPVDLQQNFRYFNSMSPWKGSR
ncbi:MAG: NADH-quinone oxidoreductase subunit C [Aaplasma endosymbiont of Hyalomma asiaticum]